MEKWRDAPDWEDLYEVSNEGRVRRKAGTFRAPNAPRILRPGLDTNGRQMVVLCRGVDFQQSRMVHRLVARAFLGEPSPEAPQVNHKDGDPTNNLVSNLEWVSSSENMLHRSQVLGYTHSIEARAKMSRRKTTGTIDPDRIAALRKEGLSLRAIGLECGITKKTVMTVLRGKHWTQITHQ